MVDMHLLQTGVSLNLKMRARFQIQTSLRLEPDFEYGRQIRIQTKEGIGTCWEESPSLAIETKVYKRM